MGEVIRLDDHRPTPPLRRRDRLALWADDALATLIMASGLCCVAYVPGAALAWAATLMWPNVPWYVTVALKGVPAILAGLWVGMSMHRWQRRTSPTVCTVNVHVFADETAAECKCGATVDAAGGDAA